MQYAKHVVKCACDIIPCIADSVYGMSIQEQYETLDTTQHVQLA
jgi:hypothetical protein